MRRIRMAKIKSYNERLRGYEKDKAELLRRSAELTPAEFDQTLQALIKKWKI